MTSIDDIVAKMKQNPKGMRFNDFCKSKACQVRQVLSAIERLENDNGKSD